MAKISTVSLLQSLSLFASSYTWYVPIKWMKTGVEQQQYWLLQKTGMFMVTSDAPLWHIRKEQSCTRSVLTPTRGDVQ